MGEYLVTGGAGFIGSNLTRRLVESGSEVRVLDNLSTGHIGNLQEIQDRIEFVQGDMRDPEICRSACAGIEVVFHLAALPSVPRSVAEPDVFHATNIDGTFQLLLAARDCDCRRVVYAASSSAYGDQPDLPKRESQRPDPKSPYALQKLVGEYYGRVFFESYGLETISLRYFNVFGPRQDPKSQYAAAIPAFIEAILKDRAPTIYGDGLQTRDFTYIDNVVDANLKAASLDKTRGEVVNIACGSQITINEVVETINRILGKHIQPRYEAPRAGDVLHSVADVSAARALLDYTSRIDFEEGLRRTIDWYSEHMTR